MSTNITWHDQSVTQEQRAEQKAQKPCVLWFTGLSGAGKSTIANALDIELYKMGYHTYLLDGDNVRHGLNKDLGFSDKDRVENIRRIGESAKLFVEAGILVMTAFISPFKADREMVRTMLEIGQFIEVFVDTPLDICEDRDPKGLYKKARAGEIKNFTGIDSAYEAPKSPEIVLDSGSKSVSECVAELIEFMKKRGLLVRDLKDEVCA